MRTSTITAALAATLVASTSALNILVNNDDGFASANIREMYRLLVADGHNVTMVAPIDNESGQGGRSVFTNSNVTQAPSEYNIIPAGSPSLGRDPNDPNIWYYNGTPAACTFVALDWVIPQFYNNRTTDLLVAGPNFGTNLGPFLYTLSGTMGATYAAVGRNLPAIAFSAGNSGQRSYMEINQTTPSNHSDPATIAGELAVSVVRSLINGTAPGERLLPLGYGLSVNWATVNTLSANATCITPTFYQTRLTGGAFTDKAVRNSTTGVFTYGNLATEAINHCINGNCSLPGETAVVSAGCYGSISTFTIDYSAPNGTAETSVREKLAGVAMSGMPSGMMKRDVGAGAYEAGVARRHE